MVITRSGATRNPLPCPPELSQVIGSSMAVPVSHRAKLQVVAGERAARRERAGALAERYVPHRLTLRAGGADDGVGPPVAVEVGYAEFGGRERGRAFAHLRRGT